MGWPVFSLPHCFPCAFLSPTPSTRGPVCVRVSVLGCEGGCWVSIYFRVNKMLICICKPHYHSFYLFTLIHIGYWSPLSCRPPKATLKVQSGHPLAFCQRCWDDSEPLFRSLTQVVQSKNSHFLSHGPSNQFIP